MLTAIYKKILTASPVKSSHTSPLQHAFDAGAGGQSSGSSSAFPLSSMLLCSCLPTRGSVKVERDPWKRLEPSLSESRNKEVLEGPFLCLDAAGLSAALTMIRRSSDF